MGPKLVQPDDDSKKPNTNESGRVSFVRERAELAEIQEKLATSVDLLVNQYHFDPAMIEAAAHAFDSEPAKSELVTLLNDTDTAKVSVRIFEPALRLFGDNEIGSIAQARRKATILDNKAIRDSLATDTAYTDQTRANMTHLVEARRMPITKFVVAHNGTPQPGEEKEPVSRVSAFLGAFNKRISQKNADKQLAKSYIVGPEARFPVMASLQMELIGVVDQAADFVTVFATAKSAKEIANFASYRAKKLTDFDPLKAMDMVRTVMDFIEAEAAKDPLPSAREFYENILWVLQENLNYAQDAINHVGKEWVQENTPSDTVQKGLVRAVKTNEQIVERSEEAPLPPEMIAELETLDADIASFNRTWFDKGRKWRENGFADLFAGIVRNEKLADKELTPRIIGVAAHIDETALTDAKTALDELSTALDEQLRLTYAVREIKDGPYKKHSKIVEHSFFITDIKQAVSELRERWAHYNTLIQQRWPNFGGQAASKRIEGVLFDTITEEQSDDTSHDELFEELRAEESAPNTGEITVLRDLVEQLDEILLPPGASKEVILEQLSRLEEDLPSSEKINWEKLRDLIELRGEFGGDGKIFRSKIRGTGHSEEYGEVYYSLVFDLYGKRFAVAESPKIDNATYVVDETSAPGTWLEMLKLAKRDLRAMGGKQIIHSSAAPFGPMHREKIIDYITERSQ